MITTLTSESCQQSESSMLLLEEYATRELLLQFIQHIFFSCQLQIHRTMASSFPWIRTQGIIYDIFAIGMPGSYYSAHTSRVRQAAAIGAQENGIFNDINSCFNRLEAKLVSDPFPEVTSMPSTFTVAVTKHSAINKRSLSPRALKTLS